MIVDYVPKKGVRRALVEGWRTIPDYEYRDNDFAIIMYYAGLEAPPLSDEEIYETHRRFNPMRLVEVKSNRTLASEWRNKVTWGTA